MFRFFTVYGPWGRPDMALFKFTRAILEDRPSTSTTTARCTATSPMWTIWCDGISRLIDAVPPLPESGAAPVEGDSLSPVRRSGWSISAIPSKVRLLDFIDAIEAAIGRRAIRNYMPMQQGDVPATWADAESAQNLTGYRPVQTCVKGWHGSWRGIVHIIRSEVLRHGLAAALVLAALTLPAAARDLWVSGQAADGGDGSRDAPFGTLKAALRVGGSGDRILLDGGAHGNLMLQKGAFEPPLTITSAPGTRARLARLTIRGVSGLRVTDLDIWPDPETPPYKGALVRVTHGSQDVRLSGLDIRGRQDAADYLSWDKQTWQDTLYIGVVLKGDDLWLTDSRMTGVATGFNLNGRDIHAVGNTIRGFSQDGIRVFGDGVEIRRTDMADCVRINSNHDDALQSWSAKGNAPDVVRNITVAQNRFVEWTGPKDHPLRCTLQGIGLFNGPYENWVIENNLILVGAYHGMAIGGMSGAVIRNNTVIHIDGETGKAPWISLGSKNQDGSNIVTGNVANAFRLGPDLKQVARQENYQASYPARLFENFADRDMRPAADSPLVDALDPGTTPEVDIDGVPRSHGGAADLGAFERR